MKEFKGTKGEWMIDKYKNITANGKELLYFDSHINPNEAISNANLICASKDLLHALQNTLSALISFVGDEHQANEWIEVIEAKKAINKALD